MLGPTAQARQTLENKRWSQTGSQLKPLVYLSLRVLCSEACHCSHTEQRAPIDLESQKMSGSTCGLSRSDTLGRVSGDTPMFLHKRHGPVAKTSATEATMSNIAAQMRHSSTTMLGSFKRTSLVM